MFQIIFVQIQIRGATCRLLLTVSQNPGNTAAAFGYRAPVYPQKYPPRANAGCRLLFAAAANGAGRAIIRAAGRTDSRRVATRGGKSGLHRAGCRLTAGCGNATESGTESQTADGRGNPNQVRVKRCGKSAPRNWQQLAAGKTPSAARPNRTH